MGDEVSSSRYWHGKLFDAWAAEWMRYFTDGKGEFVTTAMEDTGTLQSLSSWPTPDASTATRILVLRTVSNFDRQPRGMTAAESLATSASASTAPTCRRSKPPTRWATSW